MAAMTLIGVHTRHDQVNENVQDWARPFNQAAFVNLGPDTFTVNLFPVPAGKQHVVSLNVGEVNIDTWAIDFQGATDKQCWIVYTLYDQVKLS